MKIGDKVTGQERYTEGTIPSHREFRGKIRKIIPNLMHGYVVEGNHKGDKEKRTLYFRKDAIKCL